MVENGLNEKTFRDHNPVEGDDATGLSVTQNTTEAIAIAMERQAERIGDGGPGMVLEFSDDEVGDLLIRPNPGTKTGEAIIPFEVWDQVKPKILE